MGRKRTESQNPTPELTGRGEKKEKRKKRQTEDEETRRRRRRRRRKRRSTAMIKNKREKNQVMNRSIQLDRTRGAGNLTGELLCLLCLLALLSRRVERTLNYKGFSIQDKLHGTWTQIEADGNMLLHSLLNST